ncbi:polymerase, partial [Cronobacter sakazakii]|nr:polymerase [Cronobacter sakazakii]
MITSRFEKLHLGLMQLLFGLCAIAFGYVVVSPNFAAKIFSVAGAVALIVFIIDIKNFKKNDAFWLC